MEGQATIIVHCFQPFSGCVRQFATLGLNHQGFELDLALSDDLADAATIHTISTPYHPDRELA